MDDDLVSIREESAYEAFSQFTIDDEDDECQMEEFDKFYGTGDPEQHLNPFTGATAHKEILLFQQFPLSLTGPSLSWYSGLPIANTQELD